MGLVFRRSSGRAWRLRRRSMELWPQWAEELSDQEQPLQLQTPLVQVAATEEEGLHMQALAKERQSSGLRFLSQEHLQRQHPDWPGGEHGALLSAQDGRIDPLALLKALRKQLTRLDVTLISEAVTRIRRAQPSPALIGKPWTLELQSSGLLETDQVVVCSALAAQPLLTELGHQRAMEPVLGQVLDLELAEPSAPCSPWPAVLVCQGINLVRQGASANGRQRLWLGATLEPGTQADPQALNQLLSLQGQAPAWLQRATVVQHWQGLRARPIDRPAPLLEVLEPGLILASGHYRNGVLLAPATAEWVCEQITTR